MRKRLISMLLVVSMLLSLTAPAFAADARQTDFFADQPHADVNFKDMLPADVNQDDYQAKADDVRKLLGDSDNTAKVKDAFQDMLTLYKRANTAYNLVYIYHAQNASDEELAVKLEDLSTSVVSIGDAFNVLIRDILLSDCEAAMDDILTEEEKEVFRQYEPMSDRAIELQGEITALVNQYYSDSEKEYTASLRGKTYTLNEAEAAAAAEEITLDDYASLSDSITKKRNQVLGNTYLKLIPLYKEVALEAGYESYVDYAYEKVFNRGYRAEDLRAYREAVKQYTTPLIREYMYAYYRVSDADIFSLDYSGDKALDAMTPCVEKLSSEMTEALDYMRDHGLYDSDYDVNKMTAGFTTILPEYNAPFFFNDASQNGYDLAVAIHEFGHFNRYYWEDNGLTGVSLLSYDCAEVHSQGLELLMQHYYPEMLGEVDAVALEAYQLLNFVYFLSVGALFDELQLYAFDEDNLTLDKLNQKYCELAKEYGVLPEEYEDKEAYDWVEVPHSYESPLYYISYSTSGAGAFAIWQEAQKDYFKAVDKYLEFASLDSSMGIQEGFEAVGMASPISGSFIQSLGDSLREYLNDLNDRIAIHFPAVGKFKDVPEDAWYTSDVASVYYSGLMSGMSETVFAPNESVNRAMAAATLYRVDASPEQSGVANFIDVDANSWYNSAVIWGQENSILAGYPDKTYRPTKNVTREELVSLMYRYAQKKDIDTSAGEDTNILSYKDAESVSEYAMDAMMWACAEGIIQGTDTGELQPKKSATRAELAAITVRFVNLIYDALYEDQDIA